MPEPEPIGQQSSVEITTIRAAHADGRRAIVDVFNCQSDVKALEVYFVGKEPHTTPLTAEEGQKFYLIRGKGTYEDGKGKHALDTAAEGERPVVQEVAVKLGKVDITLSAKSCYIITKTQPRQLSAPIEVTTPYWIPVEDSNRQGNVTRVVRPNLGKPICFVNAIITTDRNLGDLANHAHFGLGAEVFVAGGRGMVSMQKAEKAGDQAKVPGKILPLGLGTTFEEGDVFIVPPGYVHTIVMEPGATLIASCETTFDPKDIYSIAK